MSRSNIVLMAVAAVQVVVLIVMGASDSDYVQEGARVDGGFRPLKDLAKGSVTEISIANGDGEQVVATMTDGKWVLANRGGYPVREQEVEDTIKALRKLYAFRALTRDPARFADLEVAENKYHLQITIKGTDGRNLDEFYLGERGGADKLVYRKAGEDVAWAAMGPDSWSFNASPGSWVDSQYIDLPKDDVRRIKIVREGTDTLELLAREKVVEPEKAKDDKPVEAPKKTEVSWAAIVDGKEDPCDTAKVSTFISSLTRIYMGEPIGRDTSPEQGLDKPTAQATLTMKDGKEITLSVGAKREKENDWFFRASSSEYIVTIRDYTVTDHFQKKVADLLQEKEKSEEEPKKGKGEGGGK